MGNIGTATKSSRLKSMSSIEDNYLEAATWGVLQKALFLNISQYSQENNCWEFVLNKIAGLQACNFIEKRLQHRFFLVHIENFHLFWNLGTSASDYFTLVIYLFSAVSLQLWRKTMKKMFIEIRCNNPTTYALKGRSKSLKYTWWSSMYQL